MTTASAQIPRFTPTRGTSGISSAASNPAPAAAASNRRSGGPGSGQWAFRSALLLVRSLIESGARLGHGSYGAYEGTARFGATTTPPGGTGSLTAAGSGADGEANGRLSRFPAAPVEGVVMARTLEPRP